METIGDRIRQRRKELRLTQGEVAKRSGMGTGTISDMENGRQHETTKPLAIAKAIGVNVEWLTSGQGPMLLVEGVREQSYLESLSRHKVHDVPVTREGAEIGAEWDKIEGDEYKQLARDFIFSMVAAQKRAARRPGKILTTSAKGPKTKDRRVSYD